MPPTLTFKYDPPKDIAAFSRLGSEPDPYLSPRRCVRLGPYSGHIVYGDGAGGAVGTIVLDVQRNLFLRLFDSIRSRNSIPFSGRRPLTASELAVCQRIEMLYGSAYRASRLALEKQGTEGPGAAPAKAVSDANERIRALHLAFTCANRPLEQRTAAVALARKGPDHWAAAVAIFSEPAVAALFWTDPPVVREMLTLCPDAESLLSLAGEGDFIRQTRLATILSDEEAIDHVKRLLCCGLRTRKNLEDAWALLRQFMSWSPQVNAYVLPLQLDRPQYASPIFAALFDKMTCYRDASILAQPRVGLDPRLYCKHLTNIMLTNRPLRDRLLTSVEEDANYVYLLATEPNSKVKPRDAACGSSSMTRPAIAEQILMDKRAEMLRFALEMFAFIAGRQYRDCGIGDMAVLPPDQACDAASNLLWGHEQFAKHICEIALQIRGPAFSSIEPLIKCHPNPAMLKLLKSANPLYVDADEPEASSQPGTNRCPGQLTGKAPH